MIASMFFIVLVLGGLLLIFFRDFSRSVREANEDRESLSKEVDALNERIHALEEFLSRQGEDILVLTHVVLERGIVDEDDLEEIRHRCVEVPLRSAQEQRDLLRDSDADHDPIIIDDGKMSRIH